MHVPTGSQPTENQKSRESKTEILPTLLRSDFWLTRSKSAVTYSSVMKFTLESFLSVFLIACMLERAPFISSYSSNVVRGSGRLARQYLARAATSTGFTPSGSDALGSEIHKRQIAIYNVIQKQYNPRKKCLRYLDCTQKPNAE